MIEKRLNKCFLAVGRKGTGKTTIAQMLAKASGKKICVVDTDDHPSYDAYELWKISDLHDWKTGNIKIVTSEPEAALIAINKNCSNAFIILEDAAKYVTANVQRGVKSFIIDHRKRNFDLIIMFHFLGDVPPYLAKQYDSMLLFKTGDNLDNPQKKFANWHTISEKAKRILDNKSFNYCEKINVDE
jgi:Mrp family chromosome partitioning ATPase